MTTESQPRKSHAVKIVREVIPEVIAAPVHHRIGFFHRLSQGVSNRAGSPVTFALAILVVVIWALVGPALNFSETWQLTINTTTTIVTFLMVFAIQNTQNRDSKAMQIKLDELLNANHGARSTEFVDIEELSDSELENLHVEFKTLHDKFIQRTEKKHLDMVPEPEPEIEVGP